MRLSGLGKFALMAIGASLVWQGGAQGQSPEEFYKGKTVTLVIAAASGGAADTLGRTFAPYFAKHIPGQPDLVVVNKPGAGGMVGASELMISAEKDGTVIGSLLSNEVYVPLLQNKHEQFDPRKVKWLGAIDRHDFPYAMMVWKSSPAQTAKEVFEKEVIVGSTSYAHVSRVFPALLEQYVGAKLKIVPGYKGSSEIYVAMERGEVDSFFQSFTSITNRDQIPGKFVAEGNMKPILAVGFERHPDWPDVPSLADYVTDKDTIALMKFFFAPVKAGRPFAVPAEVPADRVAALRKAFNDTLDDPEAQAALTRVLEVAVDKVTGEELEQSIAELYATPDGVVQVARDMVSKKN